jgi:hypothetical protein
MRIPCNKIDVEKVYCQLHTSAAIATKCISIWFPDNMWNKQYPKLPNRVTVLVTRLPFGSFPNPAEFCTTSEMAFYLVGNLLYCNCWDPITLPSPYTDHLPAPSPLPANVAFGQAAETDMKLDPNLLGDTDS